MFTLDAIDIGDPSDSSIIVVDLIAATIVLSQRGTYIYRLKRGWKRRIVYYLLWSGLCMYESTGLHVQKQWWTKK